MSTGFSHRFAGELEYLVIPQFEAAGGVKHCFSTRLGGVSAGGCGSLNLGFNRGESRETVMENYRRVCAALGVPVESLVLSAQTHTDHIRRVGAQDAGAGILRPGFCDVDGLSTCDAGVTLVTFYADCVPLFFYDPVRRACALVHSGWRGTVQRIGEKAVEHMRAQYGSDPGDILAAVGPSAGPCCYEVSDDVALQLMRAGGSLDCLRLNERTGRLHADLWRVNERILLAAGILPQHLTVCRECTVCDGRLYYSHRRQGADRGSLAAFMTLTGGSEK